jgi:hypothetical protein
MSDILALQLDPMRGKGAAILKAPVTKEASVERVRVVVRCRPPTPDEGSAPTCCVVDLAAKEVSLHDPRGLGLNSAKIFTFDAVYGASSTQAEVDPHSEYPPPNKPKVHSTNAVLSTLLQVVRVLILHVIHAPTTCDHVTQEESNRWCCTAV